jgi:hypothetical protein
MRKCCPDERLLWRFTSGRRQYAVAEETEALQYRRFLFFELDEGLVA